MDESPEYRSLQACAMAEWTSPISEGHPWRTPSHASTRRPPACARRSAIAMPRRAQPGSRTTTCSAPGATSRRRFLHGRFPSRFRMPHPRPRRGSSLSSTRSRRECCRAHSTTRSAAGSASRHASSQPEVADQAPGHRVLAPRSAGGGRATDSSAAATEIEIASAVQTTGVVVNHSRAHRRVSPPQGARGRIVEYGALS